MEARTNENMTLYNAVRAVPPEAQKPIEAGRLKGKTDINPMWRIRVLTECFGPCGKGWYTDGVSYWTVPFEATGELAVFCQLKLHVKQGDEWIAPIYGIGGNKVIAREKNGMYLDDEAYKKAYTDAMSVACKALGVGADVYWQADRTKYSQQEEDDGKRQQEASSQTKAAQAPAAKIAPAQTTNAMPEPAAKIDRRQSFNNLCQTYGVQDDDILATINTAVQDGYLEGINGNIGTMTDKDFARCMAECERRFRAALS